MLTGHGAAIDTSAPSCKLAFGSFAALAQFERELIVEGTRAAWFAPGACGAPGRTNTSSARSADHRTIAGFVVFDLKPEEIKKSGMSRRGCYAWSSAAKTSRTSLPHRQMTKSSYMFRAKRAISQRVISPRDASMPKLRS